MEAKLADVRYPLFFSVYGEHAVFCLWQTGLTGKRRKMSAAPLALETPWAPAVLDPV
jgi:hypothetical protein